MIATIAVIAAITERKKFSDRSDHMETTFQQSQQQRSLKKFYLSDRCCCDHYDHILFSKVA